MKNPSAATNRSASRFLKYGFDEFKLQSLKEIFRKITIPNAARHRTFKQSSLTLNQRTIP